MTSSPPTVIAAFLQDHPGIKYATRASADYPALRANYAGNPALPLIILRPQTADDVAALIIYCVAQNLDFVVRSGGHDLCGRSTVQDAVTIDLRDIAHIQVSADKKTARIGGGILFSKLLEGLGTHGLITPVGTIGTVGYVGWATLGGYGPYSSSYGLGLDQIVGAKVVNADGRLVDADARMLKGIRGSGGNYGVIVELTVKVYPVQEVSLVNNSLCYQFLLIMSIALHSLIHPTLEYNKHSYVVHERMLTFIVDPGRDGHL
jgi:FAD/FMN-containing dehydrogenase